MDISPPPPPPPLPPPPPQSKPDRKTVEKNRRSQMKFLYSKLDSLITSSSSASTSGYTNDPVKMACVVQLLQLINTTRNMEIALLIQIWIKLCSKTKLKCTPVNFKQGPPLPDRLDEAANYIKRVQERIEELKEKKRELIGSSEEGSSNEKRLPQIEVIDLGSGLNAVLIISSDHDRAIMHKSVRAVEGGGSEVLNAHYTFVGDKSIVSLHTLARDTNESGSVTVTGSMLERLKKAF